MIFRCSTAGLFKITAGAFSEPKIYWKKGLDWIEMEDAEFKDAGVLFRGLGYGGGVALEDMVIELPLYCEPLLYH